MPKYHVTYSTILEVEAETRDEAEEEARRFFWDQVYDHEFIADTEEIPYENGGGDASATEKDSQLVGT